jgi:prephenate dehydratase
VTKSAPSDGSIAYLGPAGTFTEQALLSEPDLAAARHLLCASWPDVLAAVGREAELGFAAIENSIEGSVNVVQDALAFDHDLLIQREVIISVQLSLLVRPGTTLGDIKRVVTFPVAGAQCRGFLRRELPDAVVEAANSTADAARLLAEDGDTNTAAIGTRLAATLYGLEILADEIEDNPENKTRFVVLAADGIPAETGHDKTSIVLFQRNDRPGSLLSILQEFAARSINLTRLESRPTKQALGSYCFLIDLEGHISDEKVADCLKNVLAKEADIKFLGSYPVAGHGAAAAREEAGARWTEAEAWVGALRARVRATEGP